jgi:3-oxoacyl-[acyl-carrier protein] reductase
VNLALAGRRALVGGATSGLGLAVARALAAEGCALVLWSRDEARLRAVRDDLLRQHPSADIGVIACDAGDQGAADLVSRAAQDRGPVDIAVLNGGGPPPADPAQTTAEGWAAAFQAQATTPIMLATRLLPAMREAGFGRIIGILSSGVAEPISNLPYSNSARAALAMWLKTVSSTVAADGVTVNGIMPGRIDTPRVAALDRARAAATGTPIADVQAASIEKIPAGRYGQPAELASLAAYLSSPLSSYITGRLHAVDGGMIRGL